jgi:hypothetical protein
MHRVCLGATIVALFSVISFSAGALVSGSAVSRDAGGPSVSEATAAPKTALGPGGKPVRVISLSLSDREADAAAAPQQPQLSLPQVPALAPPAPAPVAAEEGRAAEVQAVEAPARPAMRPVERDHPTLKRIVARPARTRAASARAEKPFIVSGLF